MEIKRSIMKQPSRESQQKQYNLKHDVPFIVQIGSRNYRCTYLKGKSQDMISYLHLSQKIIDTDDTSEILAGMKYNNRIHAKCVAIMILNSYWKIKFFYQFFWRWLFHTYSSKDFSNAMQQVMEANGVDFFLSNSMYLFQTNMLKMKMTREELSQLYQGQASANEQASSKSSPESQDTTTTGASPSPSEA